MKTIQIYDKPMCCSTGVCGPEVDPVLPRFAADLDWLKSQGHQVERFNLAQQPQEFIKNLEVHQRISTKGTDCLPLIIVNGQIVSDRSYPSRETLALWTGSSILNLVANECCGGTSDTSASACCAPTEQTTVGGKSGCC